jgi:triacylglycerol esterase/lipase EstA (alpha/beta hydrolase family)
MLVIGTSMVRSSSTGFGLPWWRAFWGEFRAALTVFMFRLPWSDQSPGVLMPLTGAAPVTGDKPLPVLLVHGYICNHRVWDNITRALRQAGHPVLALDLEPPFASIDDYTRLVEQAVNDLLAATGARQVALVGHSMGGLVIRAWMRAHGTQRVARVITLGTPHQGTRIAKVSMTPNGAQMVWRSQWLQALERSETPATRSLISIALTHHDNIVYPQREQVLAGASVTEFDRVGHLELCLNPMVIGWLVQQLSAGAAAEPVAVSDAPLTALQPGE